MLNAAILGFTTPEALHLTGLTLRRLQYWDETDFIRPSIAARRGRGSPRLYSFQDVVQLRVAALLRDSLSLQALRRLKSALDVDAPFASIRFGVLPGGEVVYLGPSGQVEAARAPGQIVMTFDVPLRQIRADLEANVRQLRSRKGFGQVKKARGVVGSKAVLAGTRISPLAVKRMIAAGWSDSKILTEYPDLTPADIAVARRWVSDQKAG